MQPWIIKTKPAAVGCSNPLIINQWLMFMTWISKVSNFYGHYYYPTLSLRVLKAKCTVDQENKHYRSIYWNLNIRLWIDEINTTIGNVFQNVEMFILS